MTYVRIIIWAGKTLIICGLFDIFTGNVIPHFLRLFGKAIGRAMIGEWG